MAWTPTRLAQTQLTAADAAIYTAPVSKTVIVKHVVIANTSATSPIAVGLSLVPTGGAASNANRLVPEVSVPPNDVVTLDVAWVLTAGDFIAGKAGVASTVVVSLHGLVS